MRAALRSTHGISYRRAPRLVGAISQPCTFDQIDCDSYNAWCDRLHIRPLRHRKTWEWVYILQVLEEHDMLRAGRRGLGFGVGNEPVTAYAASQGVRILATDLPADAPRAEEWRDSNEHADELSDLNNDALCDDSMFRANVALRPVDMRQVPDDLVGFDFTWSSCAMEHLGSPAAGMEFFERQIACLKPGGIGVHTTEYNVDPYGPTPVDGLVVMYQRPHLEGLTRHIRGLGHHMKITFATGTRPEDLHVDKRPFTNTHLRVDWQNYIHTSFGLWVQRAR